VTDPTQPARPRRPERPTRRRLAAALLSLAAATATGVTGLAACGVPLDDSPREVSMGTSTTEAMPTTTLGGDQTNGRTAVIYFVDQNGGLRADHVSQDSPSVESALQALLSTKPPTGLVSSIPPGTEVLDARISGQRVTVDLSKAMRDIQSPQDRVAYAQLAFTVLAFPEHTEVTFEIEGQPVDAPTDEGNKKTVTTNDYTYPLNPT